MKEQNINLEFFYTLPKDAKFISKGGKLIGIETSDASFDYTSGYSKLIKEIDRVNRNVSQIGVVYNGIRVIQLKNNL